MNKVNYIFFKEKKNMNEVSEDPNWLASEYSIKLGLLFTIVFTFAEIPANVDLQMTEVGRNSETWKRDAWSMKERMNIYCRPLFAANIESAGNRGAES